MEEQIPASEFREFMREMRAFKQETNRKFDALVQAGYDRDQQIVSILNELGTLKTDIGELKRDVKTVLQALGAPTGPPPSEWPPRHRDNIK